MGKTLIPTMSLRFVTRYEPRFKEHYGESVVYAQTPVKVLQQRFETPAGKTEWHDVPEHSE